MQFSNTIYDETLNSISNENEFFKAPMNGLYKFTAFFSINVSQGYNFVIEASVNQKQVQLFAKSSLQIEYKKIESFAFHFDLILKTDDAVRNRIVIKSCDYQSLGFRDLNMERS